jgi:hypothetical protein
MKRLKTVASILVPLLLFVLFIILTDPYKLPLALLVAPFIFIAVFTYRLSKYLLVHAGVSQKKSNFISGIITTLLLLLLLMQSIRQLTVKDLLIMFALIVGVTLYFKRIDI